MQRRTYLAALASAWLAGCQDITVWTTPQPTPAEGALPAAEFERRFKEEATAYGMDEEFDLSIPSEERAVVEYTANEATRHDRVDALWKALVALVGEYDAKRSLDARVRRASGDRWYRWTVRNEWARAYHENEFGGDVLRERIQGTIEVWS